MESVISEFINNEDVFLPTLIAGSIVICVCVKAIARMVGGISTERTRREIAAYIAEGSMSPEQGERLMRSESLSKRGCN